MVNINCFSAILYQLLAHGKFAHIRGQVAFLMAQKRRQKHSE